jgi:hypothetical protein
MTGLRPFGRSIVFVIETEMSVRPLDGDDDPILRRR